LIHGGFWVTLERKTRKYDPSHNCSQSLKQTMFPHVQMWLTMWFLAEDWLYLGGIHINFMRKKISNALSMRYITKDWLYLGGIHNYIYIYKLKELTFLLFYIQSFCLDCEVEWYFSWDSKVICKQSYIDESKDILVFFSWFFFSIYTLFRLWEN
jgi:hypothetical protein